MNTALFRAPQDEDRQDWAALQRHLQAHGLALDLSQPPRQFAGGFGNLNYLLRIDDADWVLRRPPGGQRVAGGNDMAREFGITSKLWRGFPLAPRAIHLCTEEAVLGAPFLIMEYRPGMIIGGELPSSRTLSQPERRDIGLSLAATLAALHAVDPREVGLDALGKPEGMLVRMIDGWEKRARAAWEDDTPAAISELAGWLRQRLPSVQQGPTLLHSDFKLDNMILDPDSLQPRAVIDWDMGTRGDPLVDLATLLSYWPQADDPPAMLQLKQMPMEQAGFPTRDEVAAEYARLTGRDLSGLRFYRVLCLFKLTVVFMQLNGRYRRGEVSDERFRNFGPLALGLLDFTLDNRAGA